MNPIPAFRARLQQINAEIAHSPIPNLAGDMAKTTQRLRTEYGDIARGEGDQQSIATAVMAYLNTQQLSTYRDIKRVCFGISSQYGIPLTRVLEHEVLFPKLLNEVERLHSAPRPFRRCFQGLLKAYLRYPGQQTTHATGHKNWLVLREFLAKHCDALTQQQPALEWTLALSEHRNLLADNPCHAYGLVMLTGDQSVVEMLKTRLGIDDDTWVMEELVLAHVHAATKLQDVEFKVQLLPLVQLLERHSGLITRGLALLLRRYQACLEHPDHFALREAALQEWKSPWLEAHKPLWYAQIGEAATNMIQLWLTKQHIKDFFELLQADGQADRQRMRFWLQYAEAIDDFWLALGTHSFTNRQADYQRIRTQMEGRCMRLQGSNHGRENAFLMKIGNYIFIEFGKQGNACHIFKADNKPFITGQASVSGTTSGLKNINHSGHFKKLTHHDNWQDEFSDVLRDYAYATPSNDKPKVALAHYTSNATRHSVPTAATTSQSIATQQAPTIDVAHILEICKERGLTVQDHRSHGGALWIRIVETHDEARILKSLGFRYKEGKGWWLTN